MEKLDLKKTFEKNTEQTDDFCTKHNIKKIKIKITGSVICTSCCQEEREKFAADRAQEMYQRGEEDKRKYYLKNLSLMDEELKEATFENYKAETIEQTQDFDFVKTKAREWLKGAKNNVVLIGDTGVGKSHLAYSAIKAISDYNHKMATFVNVVDLLAKIKEDFKLEAYYVEKLAEVDYLVLDDLGTEKTSEWSSGILYSLLNKRTNTMITTNLGPTDIMRRYGKRIYSRIFKGVSEEHLYFMQNKKDERIGLWQK